MRGRIGGLAATLTFMVVAAGADAMFTSLFDGKTLNGWVPEHTDRFSVRDGVLFSDDGRGWLRSAKPYKDFEFQAEYRALKKDAESGLFFRASLESTPKEPFWPSRGYQLQVADSDSNMKIFGHGTPPPTSERKAEALKGTMKGSGEWQKVALKVVGKRAEVVLNGVPITTSEAISLPEGYLGLQAEKGHFEWRDLKVRELPAQ